MCGERGEARENNRQKFCQQISEGTVLARG